MCKIIIRNHLNNHVFLCYAAFTDWSFFALQRPQEWDFFQFFLFPESVSYEFGGRGGVITYNYPRDKQPDTKVIN